jgi:hypothetical protein
MFDPLRHGSEGIVPSSKRLKWVACVDSWRTATPLCQLPKQISVFCECPVPSHGVFPLLS